MKSVLHFLLALVLLAGRALAQEPSPSPTPASDLAPAAPAEPAATPEAAATPATEAPLDEGKEPLPERVSQRWFELREALGVPGGEAGVEEKLDELRNLRAQSGIRGIPRVARALVVEGFRALDAEDPEVAAARFRAALEFDAGAIDARLGLAAVARKRSALSPSFLGQAASAVGRSLGGLRSAPFAASNWILVLAAGLLAAGILAIAALTWSKQGLLRHDLEERVKQWLDVELARVAAWALFLLPLLLTFDPYWTALYWAVLVWAYLGIREQIVLGTAVLFCGLAVPALGLASRLLGSGADPYTAAAVAYLEGVVDPPTLLALEAHAAAERDDVDAQVLLALVHERNGQPRTAIRKYRAMAERGRDPVVLNNLGNVYYRLDEKDKALEYWQQALQADSSFAATHYNLSLYYFDMFDFKSKEQHFNQAKGLDSRLIDTWLRDGSGVIDAGIDRERIRKRIWSGVGGSGTSAVDRALASPQTIGAAAALVLGLGLGRKRRSAGVAAACAKCGQGFCNECKPPKLREDYCLQCVHLFIRKDGVSPQLRGDKIKEIGFNQGVRKATSVLLNLIAPGAGQVYRQRPAFGLVALTLWTVSLATFLLGGIAFLEPGFVARAAEAAPLWVALAVAGLVWLAANAANLLRKD